MPEDTLLPFDLPVVQRKKVTADFAGGSISSDGGLVHVRLKGTMNALFLKDLAAKTHPGLRGQVEQGRSGGGDARIVEAQDKAVGRALGWFERNAAETRVQDSATGRMVRTGDQKTVIATFMHETSRNLDPALHTHSVIANMLLGPDDKWRTMANESLYGSKMLLGALYRSELAGELAKLGYGIKRTHSDGRFEIASVSRHIIDSFSTRRAEIEAAMEGRGFGGTAENQHLARRAALMTRAAKRDVDRTQGPTSFDLRNRSGSSIADV